jgi:hypothetical protein
MDSHLRDLSSASLETRLYALQALQETLLRTEDGGGLDHAISAIGKVWSDFASIAVQPAEADANYATFSRRRLDGSAAGGAAGVVSVGGSSLSWSQMEVDTFYALLRCSNAILDADSEASFAYFFARPSVLIPLRAALSQQPQDTELTFESMKLLAVIADKYPLSFLRSRIPHDLLTNSYVFTRLPIRSKHTVLSMVYSAASVIATREDSALLMMLIPTLKGLCGVPTAREIAAASGGFNGLLEEDVSTSSSAPSSSSSSKKEASNKTGFTSPALQQLPRTSETLQESFTRELALRTIIRTFLISVGMCDFSVDTSVSLPTATADATESLAVIVIAAASTDSKEEASNGGGGKKKEGSSKPSASSSEVAKAASTTTELVPSSAAAQQRKEVIRKMERTITAKPEWPRKAVLFMLKKMQLVPFLTRALTAATTLSFVPSASSAGTASGGEASGVGNGAFGPVLMRLTTYAIRCVIRVLIRTYAFCQADLRREGELQAPQLPLQDGKKEGAGKKKGKEAGEAQEEEEGSSSAHREPLDLSISWPDRTTRELRAACARILSTAPLAHYPNNLEKEEALELCDDCSVFLMLLEREGRRTTRVIAKGKARGSSSGDDSAGGSGAAEGSP